ncbi:MAG: phosphoglycerate kinase, partial [Bacteroidales bacterium]|nr:phosphoglycerate kinase [Bacteroidales bacterium]
PFTIIIGGSKISSKIDIIESLLDKADNLIIVGGMCYTFLKAFGSPIGNSIYEPDMLDTAINILKKAYHKGVNLILPVDSVCGDSFAPDASMITVDSNSIPDGWMGMDIGSKTISRFSAVIKNSETILWNGPAGVFEFDRFTQGTRSLALCIAASTVSGAFSLVGGGDTITAINKYGFRNFVSYISTGGGAMLEYLEGKTLPGIDALENN